MVYGLNYCSDPLSRPEELITRPPPPSALPSLIYSLHRLLVGSLRYLWEVSKGGGIALTLQIGKQRPRI